MGELILEGIDGGSTLGFLCALGTLATLNSKWPGQVWLSWVKTSCFHPVIHLPDDPETLSLNERQSSLAERIADILGVPAPEVPGRCLRVVENLSREFFAARKLYGEIEKTLKKIRSKLKKDGQKAGLQGEVLKKWIEERSAELFTELNVNQERMQGARERWLFELEKTVPAMELRLGKTISITPREYSEFANAALESCNNHQRREVDLLAAFASETINNRDHVVPTPFCFITGSGHQYFFDTIGKLMRKVNAERLVQCLFHPWTFTDEGLSLRWAPIEDRRYALMWDDPSNQEVKTLWAANLLAYNGLRFLPVADIGGQMHTVGFSKIGKRLFFSWPIWEGFLGMDIIKSVLSLNELLQHMPDRARLERRGIVEIFRSERLQIGTPPLVKYNFSVAFPAGAGVES